MILFYAIVKFIFLYLINILYNLYTVLFLITFYEILCLTIQYNSLSFTGFIVLFILTVSELLTSSGSVGTYRLYASVYNKRPY